MATVAYWLQRQRKPDLQNLASHVGMKQYDNLLKPDLEIALDDYLRKNQTRLQSDPALSSFYKRLESPVKRERGSGVGATSAAAEEAKKPKQRRQTIKPVNSPFQPPLPSSPTASRNQLRPSLPPSPTSTPPPPSPRPSPPSARN
ncbi:MAG: hypothetical protein L6R42_007241 [Xanthoria sp. 1 TBL-2021]|nr:MAG: hypothetical protein L6R42_007241 [Xanthoria sp. 1 TBL-2021]